MLKVTQPRRDYNWKVDFTTGDDALRNYQSSFASYIRYQSDCGGDWDRIAEEDERIEAELKAALGRFAYYVEEPKVEEDEG